MFTENTMGILTAALGNELPRIRIGATDAKAYPDAVWLTDAIIAPNLPSGVTSFVLPERIKPRVEVVAEVATQLGEAKTLVAFGSGTINDIAKTVSYNTRIPYICVPTAPSMNGYGSRNASLIEGDKKISVQGALPHEIVMDAPLLATAPKRMVQAGFGDALSRLSAAADWQLAHEVKGENYDPRIYRLIEGLEPRVFANAAALKSHEPQALMELTHLLILEGLGMTLHASSRPYSGGEHAIAHVIEDKFPDLLHGELVAATTCFMQRFQPANLAKALFDAIGFTHDVEGAITPDVVQKAIHLRDRFGYLNRLI